MSIVAIEQYSMSSSEARAITDQIKEHTDAVWKLLVVAHEGKAWKPLGYGTWAEYVQGEFNMGRAYSYRVLDQGRVIRAIEEAVSPMGDTLSTKVDISERDVRDIKPRLSAVVDDIKEKVADLGPDPSESAVTTVVDEVVQSHRPKPETSWSPDGGFDANPFTGEVIDGPVKITERHSITTEPTEKKTPKPVATGDAANLQNAQAESVNIGRALSTFLGFAHSNYRSRILTDWWPLGKDSVPPANRDLFNPSQLRQIAQGINQLADDMEALK